MPAAYLLGFDSDPAFALGVGSLILIPQLHLTLVASLGAMGYALIAVMPGVQLVVWAVPDRQCTPLMLSIELLARC